MPKVFVVHPRATDEKGKAISGEVNVSKELADRLIKRGLAKPVEVATPNKAAKASEPDDKPE